MKKKGPKKVVIIKTFPKNNYYTERTKTGSQPDLHNNMPKETRTRNAYQKSTTTFTERYTEENKKALVQKKTNKDQHNTSFRKLSNIKREEKEKQKQAALKVKNRKKEKENQSPREKRVVNFTQRQTKMRQEKSERNIKKEKIEKKEKEMKINKSVGNLKKNEIIDKDNNNSNIIEKSILEKNRIQNNIKQIDRNENHIEKHIEHINETEKKNETVQAKTNFTLINKNENIRTPVIKIIKKEEEFKNEEPKEEKILPKKEKIIPKKEEEENKITIVEIKSNFFQLKREETKSEDENKDSNENKNDNNIYFEIETNTNENNNEDLNYPIKKKGSLTSNKNYNNNEDLNYPIKKKGSLTSNKNYNNNEDLNSPIKKKGSLTSNKNYPQESQGNKEQNKKGNKAYLKFIQNIKNSNKNNKGKVKMENILRREDPKAKLSRVVKRISMLSRAIGPIYKGINNKKKDIIKTTNNQTESNIKEDFIKTEKEEEYEPVDFNVRTMPKEEEKINLNDYNFKLDTNIENYTGIILLKFEEGEKICELQLEGEIEEINDKLIKENIEINNKEIELIDKYELEKLRIENQKIQEEFLKLKEECDKQRDLITFYENEKKVEEDPIMAFKMKQKQKQEENKERNEEEIKIKEIKDRINKYKEELKRGNEEERKNERMSCRIRFGRKDNLTIEQKMNNLEKKRNAQRFEEIKEQPNISQFNKNAEKKEMNNINLVNKNLDEKKDNIVKDKEKGYSKALDRFKKRYKKGGSVEVRTKKSEKINEIASRLENIMGKQQPTQNNDSNFNNDYATEIIREPNLVEIIQSQQISRKKAKKPHRPKI